MLRKRMIINVAAAASIYILSGCSASGLTTVDPGTGNTNTTTQSPASDLKFSKVSEDKKSQYNTLIAQNAVNESATAGGTTSNTAAPSAPSAIAPMVAVAGDAKMAAGVAAYPMNYFPQPGVFEEYVVTDFDEAKTAGFSGTYLNALNTIVKPVIANLGTDIRMVNSYGTSDDNGETKADQAQPAVTQEKPQAMPLNYTQQYQWQFTFVSSSRKEVYNIFISAAETLVLRQKWGIKDLNPTDIKIDSSDAIKIVKKAIADKSFTSPDNQPVYSDPNAETLYELPPNANWYLYLEKDKGVLVWSLNINYNYGGPIAYAADAPVAVSARDTAGATEGSSGGSATTGVGVAYPGTTVIAPPPSYPEYWYSGGYARVNATTGEILSLVRPSRYKNNYVYPVPEPMPLPAEKPPVEKQ
jgi:hypothetical protein